MGKLPDDVEDLLNSALVCELTVIGNGGQTVTHPLIPLYDGELIYLTSSVLFSRKLDHIKANHRVALSMSDPAAVSVTTFSRATIQGDAAVDDSDLHRGWERLLPLWRAKEPSVDVFLAQRVGLPLFWERAVIEVTPRRVYWWRGGRTELSPRVTEVIG